MSDTALQTVPQTVPVKFSQQFLGTTPQIVQLLPRDVPLDQFQAGLWMEFTTTPKLQDCTSMSLIKATVKAAMKGHVPGRDCFFLPFKNKGALEATMVEYYQGIVRALDRTGRVAWSKAEPVYQNDHFVCDELAEIYEFRRHIDGDRGALRCYFSAFKLKDVEKPLVRVCTMEDVEKVRRASAGGEQDAWLKWPEEMGKKTALKKHAKYLQLVPEEEEPIPAVNHSALLFGGDDAEQARLRATRPLMSEAQTQASVAAILTAPEPLGAPLSQGPVPRLPADIPVVRYAPGPGDAQEKVVAQDSARRGAPEGTAKWFRAQADTYVSAQADVCGAMKADLWTEVKHIAPVDFKLQYREDLDLVVALLPSAVENWQAKQDFDALVANDGTNREVESDDNIALPVLTLDTWLAETARGKGGTAADVVVWLREHDSDDLFGQASGLDPFAELPDCLDRLDAILKDMPVDAASETQHTPA